MNSIIFNDYRISKIKENVYHFIKKNEVGFNDKNTFFVPDKSNFLDLKIDFTVEGNTCKILDFDYVIEFNAINETIEVFSKKRPKTPFFF